jgi:hypothetical protein
VNLRAKQLKQIINEEFEAVMEEFASIEENDGQLMNFIKMLNSSVRGLIQLGWDKEKFIDVIDNFERGNNMEQDLESLKDNPIKQQLYLAKLYGMKASDFFGY